MAEVGGFFRLAISDAILVEIGRVLRREKFGWPEEEILKAQQQILRFTEHVSPVETLTVITVDPADNRIMNLYASGGVNAPRTR
jgi:hypothetical protein